MFLKSVENTHCAVSFGVTQGLRNCFGFEGMQVDFSRLIQRVENLPGRALYPMYRVLVQDTDLFDVTEGQLNLGPLQDNGGPTMTHALLPGSVAIDVIPADMCEVDEDQRGEPRPGGVTCDVGAFEVQP